MAAIYLLLFIFLIMIPFVYYMVKEAKKLDITKETILLPIPIATKKILFISDLHNRRIEMTTWWKNVQVDFVIIGGDLAERRTPEEYVRHNLRMLTSLGKTYFVRGNHDYHFGIDHLTAILDEFNVKQLNNEVIEIDGKWSVIGVEDFGTGHALLETLYLTSKPAILISHNAEIVKALEDDNHSICAMLSGHTHGGQIRLSWLALGEKGGWKKKNQLPVFISNGFGTRHVPLRLGAPPQVHIMTVAGREN
ncbi:metallophosphoesterase [Salipaludibacillus agaradhaerens]|uniref:metallophosphoesterase n=1 Tax=Salipaludibacillus agaradhaerens TaxID=76935 RepID=UPI002150F8AD|nr:metallophosphoesterase [Salipaludibacillus agaradhaerens]MCR6106547.1 metallophosphoesterase [Salipaludibacillus agaradhaerens]MCR6118580.1 metallophosphoesterase [Salipaludibacillus agaradhaerens]UJW57670.1 metallophosphoesterase [Bacillus sp. A116_S68]